MYDGCIISNPDGNCSQCVEGAVLNEMGGCDYTYINCLKVVNRSCILCQRGYTLSSNRCQSTNPPCQSFDQFTGLCRICLPSYTLSHYRCVSREATENCYIVSEDYQTCSFCKNGFNAYFGKCYTQN